jgi:hypothetical protein
MNAREKLEKNIHDLLIQFEKETGVAVEIVRVQWYSERSSGEFSKTNNLTGIDLEMK